MYSRFDAFAKTNDIIKCNCTIKEEEDDDGININYLQYTDEIIKSFCEEEIFRINKTK